MEEAEGKLFEYALRQVLGLNAVHIWGLQVRVSNLSPEVVTISVQEKLWLYMKLNLDHVLFYKPQNNQWESFFVTLNESV